MGNRNGNGNEQPEAEVRTITERDGTGNRFGKCKPKTASESIRAGSLPVAPVTLIIEPPKAPRNVGAWNDFNFRGGPIWKLKL